MKIIYTTILVLLCIMMAPVISDAQSTTTTTMNPIVGASTDFSADEDIEHGTMEIKSGITRRIYSSPSGIAELDIGPGQALNADLLLLYARHLMLTQPIESLALDDKEIQIDLYGQARILGFIPKKLKHEIRIAIDGSSVSPTVNNDAWWSWMASSASSNEVATQITEHVAASRFISVSQQKGYILEGVIRSVTK
ncbi:MAG: hypothetical protein WD335_02905 [Candidatus Paceibacterota bacterium]